MLKNNMSDLRKEFFENMEKLAKADDKIILIVGDLGFSFCEKFAEKYPKQFFNAGCIEQSMVGIAAGLALSGKKPYVYSGAVFLLSRANEFIRDDVAYNNLDVKLIGTGASGFLGFSHNWEGKENSDDLIKNLPNLKRYHPETDKQLTKIIINAYKSNKPCFIKI